MYMFNTPNYVNYVNWILIYNISNNDTWLIFSCGTIMFINLNRHDISIFTLNCNSLNIKLHVNSICANECLCMMQIFFMHLNTKI
jgi:uncharacterized membrane protein YecN with MAPEG domain